MQIHLHLLLPTCAALLLLSCSSTKKSGAFPSPAGTGKYAPLFYKGKHRLLNHDTFRLNGISSDETYGYTIDNPIMVGGDWDNAVKNERRFLNALLGPNGEAVTYTRLGSCCPFTTPHGLIGGGGVLDRYELKIEGSATPVVLYVNMYDKGILKAPKGFTFRK
jgi:hypothetical protein